MAVVCLVGSCHFLAAFGQLRLLEDRMHQITMFLRQARQLYDASAGIIVALHANKPHGKGNMYDKQQSPTAAFLNACRRHFLHAPVQMLVLEAMPLQQFPDTCGKFLGVKPPFVHPQHYPTQAWALGRLLIHIQLIVLRNSMEHIGLAPSSYFRAMVSCGKWAAARFCPNDGHGQAFVQPAMLAYLCSGTTGTAEPMPLFCDFPPCRSCMARA